MSKEVEVQDVEWLPDSAQPVVLQIAKIVVAIRSSLFYFIIFLGLLLILTSPILSGTMSAFFLIWGVSAVIYGVLGRVGVRLFNQYYD